LGAPSSSDDESESSEDFEEVPLEAEGKVEGSFLGTGSSSLSLEESESDLDDEVVLEGRDFVVGGTTFEVTFLEVGSSLSSDSSESSESEDESAFLFRSAFFLVPAVGSTAFDGLTLVGAGASLSEECER
jgi:hypothetical protein